MVFRNKKPKTNPRFIHFGKPTQSSQNDHIECNRCNQKHKNVLRKTCERIFYNTDTPNKINSTKFTPINFLPITLWNQITKKANAYFLLSAVLSYTEFSIKNNYLSFIPITTVFLISILNELREFLKRQKEDKKENSSACLVYDFEKDTFEKIERQTIKPGNLILVSNNQEIPADALIIQTSLSSGLCSINTSSLDGEANLKIRKAVGFEKFMESAGNPEEMKFLSDKTFFVKSEQPNARMGPKGWRGVLNWESSGTNESVPLDMDNFLIRGSVLKNTDWVVCVALFVGEETKLQKQILLKKSITSSSLSKKVEKFIFVIMTTQAIIIFLFTFLNNKFYNKSNLWYFYGEKPSNFDTFGFALSMITIIDSCIPISLYVTLEFSKLIHSYNIEKDDNMRCTKTGNGAKTRSMGLTDELGQVDVIFSDKTGTLTKNNMLFSSCCIKGEVFTVGKDGANKQLRDHIQKGSKDHNEFLTLLSVCHTVLPDYPSCSSEHFHGFDCKAPVEYAAESPDEKALVEMAQKHHYNFTRRRYKRKKQEEKIKNVECLDVTVCGKNIEFEVVEFFGFDSERKRLSALVYDERDGKYKLYCKGSESVIFKLMKQSEMEEDFRKISDCIDDFSSSGLRILACGYKEVTLEEYQAWKEKYLRTMENSSSEEELMGVIWELEKDLTLLGATAVEDELQDEVEDTLKSLSKAGVSVWMLTGDKTQTAFNVAKSCCLLKPEMRYEPNLLFLDSPHQNISDDEAVEFLKRKLKCHWNIVKNKEKSSSEQAFVISGEAMALIFPSRKEQKFSKKKCTEPQNHLMSIIEKSGVVICCRFSPSQKSQIVSLYMSKNPSSVTMAVGDGVNDVPMIQQANVGIGIQGKEGQQASRASNFSIVEFRHLKSLLLFHGAINCSRIAKLIYFSFYKNIMVMFLLLLNLIYSGFSNVILAPQDTLTLHNLIYSHVFFFILSVSELPYSRESAMKWPFLYSGGHNGSAMKYKKFFSYCLLAFSHAVIIFYLHYITFNETFIGDYGLPLCYISYSSFNSTIGVITAQSLIEASSITLMGWISLIYANPAWASVSYSFNIFKGMVEENYGCLSNTLKEPLTWILFLLSLCVCIVPQIAFRFFKNYNFPGQVTLIRELEKVIGKRENFRSLVLGSKDKKSLSQRHAATKDFTVGHTEYNTKKRNGNAWIDFVKSKLIIPLSRVD